MKRIARLVNPLFAFIVIQLAWVAVLIFWIVWFVKSHQKVRDLAARYSPELLQGEIDWFIMVEGILLLLAILAGVYVIFLFWQRQAALNRAQRQFIAQVTHELKSPLASLQLHLETIRRRKPSPQRLQTFVDTMLSDTARLGTLIDNLLSANRLEQRGLRLNLQLADLSEFVSGYLRPQQFALSRAGTMILEIEPGLHARFERESLETVLRNLLENALLYSDGPPRLRIALYRDKRWVHLEFQDSGRGVEKRHREKVFRMFYRIRGNDETIRGSGLGLFIVRTVIRLHRGKVWLESAGPGTGTTFHLLLPLVPAPEGDAA
jgi:signal transduction histidine kinase